jgi:hypothetical protein
MSEEFKNHPILFYRNRGIEDPPPESRPSGWPMYVIYFNPLDYPSKWVVRRWWIGEGKVEAEREAIVCTTLAQARNSLPWEASTRLNRDATDEKQIVEMWF